MSRAWRLIGVLVLTAWVCGCASIIHGSRQDLRVTSSPSGAVVRVNLNNQATTTPGVLTLNRKEIGYVLTFEKEGHKPVEVALRRTVDGWLFGNIIFGGLIGLVIDFASGSAYKLTPDEVHIGLGEASASLKNNQDDIIIFADLKQLPKSVQKRITQNDSIG